MSVADILRRANLPVSIPVDEVSAGTNGTSNNNAVPPVPPVPPVPVENGYRGTATEPAYSDDTQPTKHTGLSKNNWGNRDNWDRADSNDNNRPNETNRALGQLGQIKSQLLTLAEAECVSAALIHNLPVDELTIVANDIATECHPNMALRAYLRSLYDTVVCESGQLPDNYTERAWCSGCGWVWLFVPGTVDGCPWCWNRAKGLPVPRPAVHCIHCQHFQRMDHPHLGHCAAGQPEAPAGLWDTDRRVCAQWTPSSHD